MFNHPEVVTIPTGESGLILTELKLSVSQPIRAVSFTDSNAAIGRN
jgi:hypothetical protein